jgi:hypothetical protein
MFDSPTVIEPILGNLSSSLHQLDQSYFLFEPVFPREIPMTSYFPRSVDFENYRFRTAAHFGTIAVIPPKDATEGIRPIEIYDSAMNHLLSLFPPPDIGKVPHEIFLTADEMILWLYSEHLLLYDQRGHLIARTTVYESTPPRIQYFRFAAFTDGVLFVGTSLGTIYIIDDFTTLQSRRFGECDLIGSITIAVAVPAFDPPPDSSELGHGPALYLAVDYTDAHQIVLVQDEDSQILTFSERIDNLVFNPQFKLAAVRCAEAVSVFTADFTDCYARIELPDPVIWSIHWSGNSVILVRSEKTLRVIGMSSACVKLPVDGHCFISTEVDGARIVTRSQVYRFRELSGAPLAFAQRTESHPSLNLIYKASNAEKATATDVFAKLADSLAPAIDGCLDSATFLSDPALAHYLLKVVIFSRHKLPDFDGQRFSDIIVQRRIVEQLAQPPFFLPLTVSELLALGYDRLVMRLCNRFQHAVAYEIADYLNLPYEPIYNHWAHCVVFSGAPVAELIDKLRTCGESLDFTGLAAAAFQRPGSRDEYLVLAKAVLALNPLKGRNVPLLMQWGAWDEAIHDGCESNDVSLLLWTLSRVEAEVSAHPELKSKLELALANNLIALQMWIKMRPGDPVIPDLLQRAGQKREAFLHNLELWVANPTPANLEAVKKAHKAVKSDFGGILDRIVGLGDVARDSGVAWSSSAYAIVDEILAKDLGKNLAKWGKALGVTSDELVMRKFEVGARAPNADLRQKLCLEAIKEAKPEMLLDAVLKFKEDGMLNTAKFILTGVPDGPLKDEIQEKLQQ